MGNIFLGLFLLLVALALGGLPPPLTGRKCPTVQRDDLLLCINQMDNDTDGTLTTSEIDAFMVAHSSCIPTAVRAALTGAAVVAQCDMDASGNLTASDWSAPTGCFQQRSRQMALCRACDRCGLMDVILRKK